MALCGLPTNSRALATPGLLVPWMVVPRSPIAQILRRAHVEGAEEEVVRTTVRAQVDQASHIPLLRCQTAR